MDRFSPVAPAYIRVLVLPVGQIERSRFLKFLGRLQDEQSTVKLADVEPHIRDNDILLSPEAFPQGSLLYNYTTSVPTDQQRQLSPYELFREPLLVFGVTEELGYDEQTTEDGLETALEYLRERHPRVVLRQLLILEESDDVSGAAVDNVVYVRNAYQTDDQSLKKAICQTAAQFLTELTTYTRAMQASPSVQTPGQTARSLQRTMSQREQEKQPTSGRSTPQIADPVMPVDENGAKPLPGTHSPPATSFDQITAGSNPTSSTPRPDSRAGMKNRPGARASSQDRVSVQGFGSGTSQEKVKHRGKARVGIVIGTIHMMAGQWSEALRILVDHTNKSRMLQDHLWHAKGLENIIVCLMLHIWAGVEFQIPALCYPMADRSSAHVRGLSANIQASDFASQEAAQQASVRRLSKSLPDLLKLVLSLYRSGEGALELPFVVVAECSLRLIKLMVTLRDASAELNPAVLNTLITRTGSVSAGQSTTSEDLSRAAIANFLVHTQPSSDDGIAISDHIAILAGTISVYALLGMERKTAMAIKDLVNKLTTALIQARKRGAAEMGIHPAASLSAEAGAEAMLAIAEDSGGIGQMMNEIARIYGIDLLSSTTGDLEDTDTASFGNDTLKLNIMKDLTAFCEAAPDLHGVLRLSASLLRYFGPGGAVDNETTTKVGMLSKEDQTDLTTSISRTIGTSKSLGLSKMEATYWDPFLVRNVDFMPSTLNQTVVEKSKLMSAPGKADGADPGNPLLYDPNASRPGTAGPVQRNCILVADEETECVVTLQNPYDVSVDIEYLDLVTDGIELMSSHQPVVLKPMRLQQISFPVSPSSAGDCKVTGCKIKISGCAEQPFPIITRPWAPTAPTLLKAHDSGKRTSMSTSSSGQGQDLPAPERVTVSATIIEPQPSLVLDNTSLLESSLMLLDGERQDLTLRLRNTSRTKAAIFDVVTASDVLQLLASIDHLPSGGPVADPFGAAGPVILYPGATASFNFRVTGKPGVARVQAAFYYASHSQDSNSSKYARVFSVPLEITVNAALQVRHLDILPLGSDHNSRDEVVLAFDIGNAWPKSLSFHCCISGTTDSAQSRKDQDGTLAPGEVQRVFLPVARKHISAGSGATSDTIQKVLLERVQVTWGCEGRNGKVDASNLSISPEAVDLIKGSSIQLSLELARIDNTSNKPVAKVGSFVTLRARLVNIAAAAVPLLVQLEASASNGLDSAHDHRRFAVAGAQSRIFPPVALGQETTVDFVVCPILGGVLDFVVSARPAMRPSEAAHSTAHASASLSLIVT